MSLNNTSKFISLVLRHDPAAIGVHLDVNGWCDVNLLLDGLSGKGHTISREQLDQIVQSDSKQRYSFSEDGKSIRANQGHSVAVDLELKSQAPPDLLYHGTADRFLSAIRKDGLLKMSRQYVHLSTNESTASQVGSRHGKLVILKVDSKSMNEQGYKFYLSQNGVWLIDSVPSTYIQFPSEA